MTVQYNLYPPNDTSFLVNRTDAIKSPSKLGGTFLVNKLNAFILYVPYENMF